MTLILTLLAFAPPLTLEVSAPSEVKTGQEVPVVVRAKNVSSLPVVLVRPTPPNVRLGLSWRTELLQDGKPVLRDERSGWIAQYAGGYRISSRQFVVLQPGDSVEIYHDKFKVLLPEGFRRMSKDQDTWAPRNPLAPAEYTFRAHLGFSRTFKEDGGALTPTFDPGVKGKYLRAWTGAVDGEAKFRVVGVL